MMAGSDDVDYAISVGESIKKGLAKHDIPCEYFIKVHGKNGFIGGTYVNGEASADVFTEKELYTMVRRAVDKYQQGVKLLKASGENPEKSGNSPKHP